MKNNLYKKEVLMILEVLKSSREHPSKSCFEYKLDGAWITSYGICGISNKLFGLEFGYEINTKLKEYLKETKHESTYNFLFWFPNIRKVGFAEAKRLRVEFLEDYLKQLETC